MKSRKRSFLPHPHRQRGGMALVVVLACLVFLVALGIAFLLNSATELKSSRNYSEGGRAQMLAQTAASLAMAQITDGTKGLDEAGNVVAWACQPGMIRTYDASGGAVAAYKLFSWDVMTLSGSFNATDPAQQPPPDWFEQKAIFVDLNQPVNSGASKLYPIIDGNGLTLNMAGPAGAQVRTYDDGGQPAIAGFSIDAGKTPVEPEAGSNPVPMPVKWLYVLKEGQIVAPSGGTGSIATFTGPKTPSESNPIVGRIAFWADDESSKINVNVASEGVYWDTPRAKTTVEDALKSNQPVTGEYQRYPGHPAMTSLSTVFKKPAGSTLTDAQWAQFLYTLVPRVKDGGSQAGTVNTAWAAPSAPTEIIPDTDRLYPTVDEMIFNPDRSSNATAAGSGQVLNKTTLERAKFFLSASSRAPDVNLFNLPRVCNWPITLASTSAAYPRSEPATTAFDKLIAFCTTMRNDLGAGAYRYYFQRENPDSPTIDLPDAGGVTGLNRNRSLLEYLRRLTTRNIPGFGGNFGSKYGPDNDQILTEIFDYIRGATNLMDCTLPAANRYTIGIPGAGTAPWNGKLEQGQVVPIDDTTNGTHGFGRYRTVQGAAFLFIGQIDGDDPVEPGEGVETSQVNLVTGAPLSPAEAVAPGHIRVQAMFIPQFFCPAVGAPWNFGNFQWTVDLSSFRWGPGDVSMGFASESTRHNQNQKSEDETGFGDQFGILQVRQASGGLVLSSSIDLPKAPGTFHFSGGDATVKIYAANRTANPPASNVLVQTVALHFDQANFPLPALAPNEVAIYNNALPTSTKYNYRLFTRSPATSSAINSEGKILPSSGGRAQAIDTASTWILDEDVIRSVRLKTGDTRLAAAQKTVPSSLFEVNPKYQTTEHVLGAHTFFDGYGRPYYGAALGRLVPGLNYFGYQPDAATFPGISTKNKIGPYSFNLSRHSVAADVPFDGVAVGKSASFNAGDIPGDWDNAPYTVRDGPFINKPDEGDKSGSASVAPYDWKLKSKAGGVLTQTLFTPNREIPSAVMFGSLPTGVLANRPWQTLLFRPEPGHPGSKGYRGDGTAAPGMPADHLLLDLFHMPVVEPYAISEPLSTAGRINMNYQIVPFAYINRETGIRALLKSEKVISIRDGEAARYKDGDANGQANIRLDINVDETLKGFRERFETDHDIFRSASEICELPVVPIDAGNPTYDTMTTYWKTHRLTGDNSKERIYATLYPRLTTKSNTFTIHLRAQALKKTAGTDPTTWDEGRDKVTGEYRGAETIERYIDPNNTSIPDYTDPNASPPLSNFYKFRVVQARQFAP